MLEIKIQINFYINELRLRCWETFFIIKEEIRCFALLLAVNNRIFGPGREIVERFSKDYRRVLIN
jgi:hypothetical protein